MEVEAENTLVTPRLRLREFAVRDAAPLQLVMGRPGVLEWLKIARSAVPWEVWWRGWRSGGASARRFTVTQAGDDRLIGLVGLSGEARLHYLLDPDHWGIGLATEAVGAVLPAAFADPRLRRIDAEVFDANPASARVLQKLGFKPVRSTKAHRVGQLRPEPATIYRLERDAIGDAA